MYALINAITNINNNYENNRHIVSTFINGQNEPSPLSSFFTSVISLTITNYVESFDEKEEKKEAKDDKFIYLSFSDFDEKSKEIHKECPICIEEFTESLTSPTESLTSSTESVPENLSESPTEERLVLTACNHCYHEKCLRECLVQHNNCPVCRHEFNW